MNGTQHETTSTARRAPRVSGGVPFFGHGIAFGRDPDGFLERCRARYGDAFELRFPDSRRIFLLDPIDYQTVLAHKALRLDDFAVDFGVKTFGYDRRTADALGNHEMSRMVLRHLSGDALDDATARMQTFLRARLDREVTSAYAEHRLYSFVTRQVFAAGTDAVFGEGMFEPSLLDAFLRIDRALPALYLGIPAAILPGVANAARVAWHRLSERRRDPSPIVVERRALYDTHDVARETSGRMDTSLLWATNANTVATAFWVVFHVMRDARARATVLEEVRSIAAESDGELFDKHALKRMVYLDSTIDEVFRVTASPLIPRRALEDIVLPLASGPLRIDAGETICLYPRAMQLDAEIFESPREFRFDRFVTEDGTPARFEKRGQRLAFPVLAFGAGPSMCPGRHFARNEMKLVVATLLTNFDVELLDTSIPDLDISRIGFGTTPPARDVPFRIRRRERR